MFTKKVDDDTKRMISFGVGVVITIIGYLLLSYFTGDPLVLKKDVEDRGIWVTEGEYVHSWKSDDSDVGKHFLLTCCLEKKGEKNRHGYGYFQVTDESGRTGSLSQYASKKAQKFYLLSDEQLPLHRHLEIDTLVVGYCTATDVFKQTHYVPVLKTVSILREGTFEELAEPLRSAAEPGVSARNEGVTVTLERVEYRQWVMRAFFTLENENDFSLVNYDTAFSSREKKLSGYQIGSVYSPPIQIQNYAGMMEQELPPLTLKAHQSYTCSLLLVPVEPSEPLELTVSLRYYSSEEKLKALEMDSIEVHLIWQPDTGTGGRTFYMDECY